MRPPALKAWTSPLLDAEGRCVAREPTDAPRRMWCRSGVQVDDVTERLLTADEVAELLSVPVNWVRESTHSGAIPCVRSGGTCGSSLPPWRRGSTSADDPGVRSCCGGRAGEA